MRNILPLIFLLAIGCADSGPKSEKQHLKDLERAVTAIEDRQNHEIAIIEEQERAIKVLEGNLDKVNSEGMRQKIRNDINEKGVIIRDAEVNLANQKEILDELYTARDSLQKQ
jgi:Fe-S cluster assembly scaffold protein SufB